MPPLVALKTHLVMSRFYDTPKFDRNIRVAYYDVSKSDTRYPSNDQDVARIRYMGSGDYAEYDEPVADGAYQVAFDVAGATTGTDPVELGITFDGTNCNKVETGSIVSIPRSAFKGWSSSSTFTRTSSNFFVSGGEGSDGFAVCMLKAGSMNLYDIKFTPISVGPTPAPITPAPTTPAPTPSPTSSQGAFTVQAKNFEAYGDVIGGQGDAEAYLRFVADGENATYAQTLPNGKMICF